MKALRILAMFLALSFTGSLLAQEAAPGADQRAPAASKKKKSKKSKGKKGKKKAAAQSN